MKMIITKKNLIYMSLCCFLIMLGINSVLAQVVPNNTNKSASQLDVEAQKVKNQIMKIGQGKDITIIMKNGKAFYGSVTSIESDLVLINDVDRNDLIEIKYQDIKKIRKDYGTSRDLNGNRIPPKKHRIGLILGAAAILVPVIIVLSSLK